MRVENPSEAFVACSDVIQIDDAMRCDVAIRFDGCTMPRARGVLLWRVGPALLRALFHREAAGYDADDGWMDFFISAPVRMARKNGDFITATTYVCGRPRKAAQNFISARMRWDTV